jgi:hypothetical protein
MIKTLTKEQKAKIPEYYEKWRKIGFSTERLDERTAKAILKKYLKGFSTCKKVLFFDSPRACQLEINRLAKNESPQYYFLGYWSQSGNVAAGYCAFYDFIIENIMPPDNETLAMWYTFRSFVENLHYIWTFPDLVVCSQRPVRLLSKNNNLHCDGDAAVKYADGFSLYFLNGVSVPDWLAVTPRHKLDVHKFATLQNVEIRREFVRKVGAEKLLIDLGSKLIDKQGDYELHCIQLGGTTGEWPYLKMLNPSIGVWHIEAVGKECKTVTQALAWRDSEDNYEKPEVLT